MKRYNCLIVEDEPLAAEILKDYVAEVPFLSLKGICPDAIFAMEQLNSTAIDLLFLDLHLPKLKGFPFLKSLPSTPEVIICSAYHEYALEGYDYNVIDYLLKPVEFSRFLIAVNKFKVKSETQSEQSQPAVRPHFYININKKKVKIFLAEVIFVESLREYVRIVTQESTFLTKLSLQEAVKILGNSFLRVHRSFVVSREQISAYTATEIELGKFHVPIGRIYRDAVQIALSNV